MQNTKGKRVAAEYMDLGKKEHKVMGNIKQTRYQKKNITKKWLLSNGFCYNKLFSSSDTEVYTYRFPVYEYEGLTVLEGEFKVVLGEDEISVNVYDYNTNDKYAPFYYCEYGNYDSMLRKIYGKIGRKLKILKIKRGDEAWK